MRVLLWFGAGIACVTLSALTGAATEISPNPQGATVCVQCHGAQTGRLSQPVADWGKSVHARNGISCHSCHGGDPTDFAMAMSPDRGFLGAPERDQIPEFCGRCHIGVREDYMLSAHGRTLQRGGAHCVTCHGNHKVDEASIDLIEQTRCSGCHEYGRAEEIRMSLVETEQILTSTVGRFAPLHRIGIDTKPLADEIFAARNEFRRIFHSVEVEKVKHETARIKHKIDLVNEKLDHIDVELSRRRLIGGIVIALLLIAGVLLLQVRKSYHEDENEKR